MQKQLNRISSKVMVFLNYVWSNIVQNLVELFMEATPPLSFHFVIRNSSSFSVYFFSLLLSFDILFLSAIIIHPLSFKCIFKHLISSCSTDAISTFNVLNCHYVNVSPHSSLSFIFLIPVNIPQLIAILSNAFLLTFQD